MKDVVIPLMSANAYVRIVANLKVANVASVTIKQLADENHPFVLSVYLVKQVGNEGS